MSLEYKIDFAVIFKVKNANPNGDPLNGNRPRINLDGFGEISDVCIKRKMRDRLQEAGVPIFVQSDDRKNDDCNSLRERSDKAKLSSNKDEAIKQVCKLWFDVRAFGHVFAYKSKADPKSSKKKNLDLQTEEATPSQKDDAAVSLGIRGPVSIHPAFSIETLTPTSIQIVKSVNGEGNGSKRSSDTMGVKHRIDKGTYVFYGSINPQLAEKTNFSHEDAELIKTVLPKLFENDASSARPEGSMYVEKLIWWKHSNRIGQYSSYKVHSSLIIENNLDQTLSFTELPGLTPEIIEGF